MTRWTLSPDRIPSAWFNVVPHQPTSCPTLTAGRFDYDFGDVAGLTRRRAVRSG